MSLNYISLFRLLFACALLNEFGWYFTNPTSPPSYSCYTGYSKITWWLSFMCIEHWEVTVSVLFYHSWTQSGWTHSYLLQMPSFVAMIQLSVRFQFSPNFILLLLLNFCIESLFLCRLNFGGVVLFRKKCGQLFSACIQEYINAVSHLILQSPHRSALKLAAFLVRQLSDCFFCILHLDSKHKNKSVTMLLIELYGRISKRPWWETLS